MVALETTMDEKQNMTALPIMDARTDARQRLEQLRAEWEAAPQIPPQPSSRTPKDRPPNYDASDIKQVCEYGDIPALKALIAQKIDLHAEDDDALQYAAWNGHTEMVRLLLDNGANIHARDDYAVRMAASNGDRAMFLLLVERGAYIHADDDYALKHAAFSGHTEIVDLLLDLDANIHAEEDQSVAWAAGNGFVETVALLVRRGARIERLPPVLRHAHEDYCQEQSLLRKKEIHAGQALTAIFNAKTWAGHVPEMQKLWSQVPEALQTEFDFSHALTEASQQTLKLHRAKIVITR
jgi:hypothetical protein